MADADSPVCEVLFTPGDRFLLYTDGVVEPENAAGQAFGDHKLEQVIRNQSRSPAELSAQLLLEIRRWQPAPANQQDDITLIIVDIAKPRLTGDAGHVEARQGEAELAGRAVGDSD